MCFRAFTHLLFAVGIAWSAVPTNVTRPLAQLNRVGFDTRGTKVLVLPKPESGAWYTGTWKLLRAADGARVAEDSFPTPVAWDGMGTDEFMVIRLPDTLGVGTYVLADGDLESGKRLSRNFEVRDRAYLPLVKALAKGFYYWRASTDIEPTYGGAWSWKAGHPDDKVAVFGEANRFVAASGGWYDAGDYGKYVVNAGISAWTLGQVADLLPTYVDTLRWNIPKVASLPGLPDLLAELKWESDWLLAMQDTDGGVWNKLTTWKHAAFVMPASDVSPRFVLPKSTAATFNFIAVLAQTARLMRPHSPAYAARCSTAVEKAWAWTVANPGVLFPRTLVRNGKDTLGTGWYDVSSIGALSQPRFFAAMEMARLTGSDRFVSATDLSAWTTSVTKFGVPDWTSMGMLGAFSLALAPTAFPASLATLAKNAKTSVSNQARNQKNSTSAGYGVSLGKNSFYWGANGALANKGVLFMNAWKATGDSSYLKLAQAALDYLVGRNPQDISFVTGFPAATLAEAAHHYPMNIHHRQSSADGVVEPVPGYLSGGANSQGGDGDDCLDLYKSDKPALNWIDDECSYATNEIAINWNAPMFNLAAQLDAAYAGMGGVSVRPREARPIPGIQLRGGRLRVPAGEEAVVAFLDPAGQEHSRLRLPASTGTRSLTLPKQAGLSLIVVRMGERSQVIPAFEWR